MGPRTGLIVLTVLAAAWAWLALMLSGGPPGLTLVPVALSLALLASGWRGSGLFPSRGPRAGRVVALWIEIAAPLLAANILLFFDHFDLEFPVAAIIVGLHFLPLARGIPVRLYHATGVGFIFAGVAGLLLPAAERPMFVSISAALTLRVTALIVVLRARKLAAA